MENECTVYAFAQVDDADKQNIYEEITNGKSRFGWSWEDWNNLGVADNRQNSGNSGQLFLLRIKQGDWIVHVNCPHWGRCVAVQAKGEYCFDDGIPVERDYTERDFKHYIPIDTSSIVEFDRREAFGSINLAPRSRWHTVYATDDFVKFIDIKKQGKKPEDYNPIHAKTNDYLAEITNTIHNYNRNKDFEKFLADAFRAVPGVTRVIENGSRYGGDHGADLLVEFSYLGNLSSAVIPRIQLVVQAKSYSGDHTNTHAIQQVRKALEEYKANVGLIITTAENASVLEQELQNEGNENIQILSGEDVARFILGVSPDLIFDIKE